MKWYVHSWGERTRRVLRSGPFESEARAVAFAAHQAMARRMPILIEGPGGRNIEGAELRSRLQQSQLSATRPPREPARPGPVRRQRVASSKLEP
jgi:hypothetical protein